MPTINQTGPYLTMAVLCETAIREVDETVSIVRVIDKITANVTGPVQAETLPAVPISLKLVIMLKAGHASGAYTVRIGPEPPTGVPSAEHELPINFTGGPESGVNLIITFGMVTHQEGLYWINVRLDDDLLTRIPLQVDYSFTQRTEASPPD